jgi:hypothetical protein
MHTPIKNTIASYVLGYMRHVFMSQVVFFGWVLAMIPIIILAIKNPSIAVAIERWITWFSNLFLSDSVEKFAPFMLGVLGIVLPLINYGLSRLFSARSDRVINPLTVIIIGGYLVVFSLIDTIILYTQYGNQALIFGIVAGVYCVYCIALYMFARLCSFAQQKLMTSSAH